jgi:hypothetical protein
MKTRTYPDGTSVTSGHEGDSFVVAIARPGERARKYSTPKRDSYTPPLTFTSEDGREVTLEPSTPESHEWLRALGG